MNFLKESVEEIRKVTWPTRNQAIQLSIIVIIFTVIATGILIVSDKSFRAGYEALLNSSPKVQSQEAIAPETQDPSSLLDGIEATDADGNPIEINLEPEATEDSGTLN